MQVYLLIDYIQNHKYVVEDVDFKKPEIPILKLSPLIIQVNFDIIKVKNLQVVVLLNNEAKKEFLSLPN